MKFAKVDITKCEVLDLFDDVPENIRGLAQETLNDLSVIKEQLPEFDGIGFWPVEHVYNHLHDATCVKRHEHKVVLMYISPKVNVYYEPPQVHFPKIGNGKIEAYINAGTPITSITSVGNIFTKMMYFVKAGDVMEGHCHAYDHPTLLAKGSVEVDYQGIKTKFSAPSIIYIRAETYHQITALEDETLAYCIHPLRNDDAEADILDPASIPDGINPVTIAKRLLVNE